MILLHILVSFVLKIAAKNDLDNGFCEIKSSSCGNEDIDENKLLFYDVNPPEGFNLRRDVYMRLAILLAQSQKSQHKGWNLVLPPWYNLYHWKSGSKPLSWSTFFDIPSLKSFAPVIELHDTFTKTPLQIDILYVLQNYDDPFEGGTFTDKWEVFDSCYYSGMFWGYNNITVKETVCVRFQGKISKLWELVVLHPSHKKIMLTNAEIPLHDTYGSKIYWDCRKSMKFNTELVDIAVEYISNHLDCNTIKCDSYISVHWRRQDFVRSRYSDVPSITGTAKQIDKAIKTHLPNSKKVFIATDASSSEFEELEAELSRLNYKVYSFVPSVAIINKFHDGGIAIIDQIICSRSAFFIGTHESTFTFRIQEEREIIGFDSRTTFNRLCPDKGSCEKPSKWTIIN